MQQPCSTTVECICCVRKFVKNVTVIAHHTYWKLSVFAIYFIRFFMYFIKCLQLANCLVLVVIKHWVINHVVCFTCLLYIFINTNYPNVINYPQLLPHVGIIYDKNNCLDCTTQIGTSFQDSIFYYVIPCSLNSAIIVFITVN